MNYRINIDLGDSDEAGLLLDNLREFSKLSGMSQKRMVLFGIASFLEQSEEGAQLIKQIADYMSMPRKTRSDKKWNT